MTQTDKNLANMVELILSGASKNELEYFYNNLSYHDRMYLIQYMEASSRNDLFLKIRNHAENLAR